MFSMLVVLTSWIVSKMLGSVGQGSGESGAGQGQGEPNPPPPPDNPPAGATFTQADLDRIAGRTRDEERRKAETALADQLGVPLDEAKAIIEAKRETDDAQKTEAQRAREEADREKVAAAEERRLAAEERRQAKAERALMAEGVDIAKLGRATTLLLADIGETDDAEKVKDAVTSIKAELPDLFRTGPAPAPSSDPSGQPPTSGNGGTAKGMEAGRERARKEIERETQQDDPFAGLTMIGGSK